MTDQLRQAAQQALDELTEYMHPSDAMLMRCHPKLIAASQTLRSALAADVVRDAERWRVSNMIHEAGWKHSTRQTKAESVARSAYQEAVSKGLNHEAATDAAIAAMKGADHE